MNSKEYKMPDGRTALFLYDEYEVGQITLEAMDSIMSMIPKWIPCNERLPKEKQVVLITNGKGHVRCGQYQCLLRDLDPTKWWWKNKTIETVMAWMPLPTPYIDTTPKEGEKE